LLSSVSIMELLQGMRNKHELKEMTKKLKNYNVIHFNEEVSERAIMYIKEYRLSHNLQIPDAIIAAIAVEFELTLFTYNLKDFQFIPQIKLFKK
ncbi:MAG: PIN domain-containing protein, partial [Cytophagales bacterium]|nr:PIN domain-containing protein [Cytophagales bacterium]